MAKAKPQVPEEIVYRGRLFEIVHEHVTIGDKDRVFEQARRAPGIRLIIPTSKSRLLISREFRREINGYDYRLPGGKVFDTLEEYNQALSKSADLIKEAEKAAKLEAVQEVGIDVGEMELFATSRLGATVQWDLFYFIVNNYVARKEQELEDGEDIQIQEITLGEAELMCLSGQISEERSALVLIRYLHSKKG